MGFVSYRTNCKTALNALKKLNRMDIFCAARLGLYLCCKKIDANRLGEINHKQTSALTLYKVLDFT